MRVTKMIAEELKKVKKRNRGKLTAPAVVRAAESKKSPLHGFFTWDNTKAAGEYRKWQARKLIAVVVEKFEVDFKPVRAFVSLKRDRISGGGYREITEVMSSKQLRQEMLTEALEDHDRWHERYRLLKELAPIIKAAARVKAKHIKKPPKGKGRKSA